MGSAKVQVEQKHEPAPCSAGYAAGSSQKSEEEVLLKA